MKFEFDLEKSIINKIRHGIDFFEAEILWGYPTLHIRLKTKDAPCSAFIGMIGKDYWIAMVKHIEDYICPLTVRPAREEEIALYEENAF